MMARQTGEEGYAEFMVGPEEGGCPLVTLYHDAPGSEPAMCYVVGVIRLSTFS